MLTRVSIGWKWLADHLNTIIDEVNVNRPIGSASITTDQSPGGTVLRIASPNNQQPSGGGGDGGGGQQPPPQPVVWHNVGWVTVTVVDPASCTQSSLTVLAQKSGSSITIS